MKEIISCCRINERRPCPMKYYFAPMEGITGYIQRNASHTFFPDIDKYFTAFIAPNQNGRFSSKVKNDILPVHNEGCRVVPQILTNSAQDFILTERKLSDYGYREMNLNLGCPSKTVVSKFRGSGFLAKKKELDQFLAEIFARTSSEISIKTRIGKDHPEEFYELIEIYNKYPLKELIIHPRTQLDFYKNEPHIKVFKDALHLSRNPVCYNGDIFTKEDFERFMHEFPQTGCVMLGRGLLMNPGLAEALEGNGMPDKERIKRYHDQIYLGYQKALSGEKPVLYKMKELWGYMIRIFSDHKKYAKKIKKAERPAVYEEAVSALFREQDVVSDYTLQ